MSETELASESALLGRPRVTAGLKIYKPLEFFEWTSIPFAHCFGLAAFAFHLEHARREWRSVIPETELDQEGMLDWLRLTGHEVRIDTFYGALRIDNPIPPYHRISIDDEGQAVGDLIEESGERFEPDFTARFEALRPGVRKMVSMTRERAIILEALQVRGRKNNALVDKEEIEVGCFYAGIEWDVDKALLSMDGAKLYDVEVRVHPKLLPQDMASIAGITEERSEAERRANSAKRSAVDLAVAALWPTGIPEGITSKDRYRKIVEFLTDAGMSIPSERTIRRTLGQK